MSNLPCPVRRATRWGCLLLVCVGMNRGAAAGEPRAEPPERIVSLGPSLTKQLYLLGAASNTVGVTTYCPQPVGRASICRAGSVVDPNIEQIVRLRPDLVLATSLTSRKAVATLEAVGLSVVEFPSAQTFDQICGQFLELGMRIGRDEAARQIVDEARARVARLQGAIPPGPHPAVFIQIGARPLCTAGKNTFLNDLIEIAAGVNIAREAVAVTYSREAVLAADPDCILVVTMGMTGPDEVRKWQRYATLTAAKQGRIHLVDSELVCSPTPASFVNALAAVMALLHPGTSPAGPEAGVAAGGAVDAR